MVRTDSIGRAESSTNGGAERSLDSAMREPSTQMPEIVVLDFAPEQERPKRELPDLKKDLWVSSVDGRHQSPLIPVTVGPAQELFQVHRDVLTRSLWFKRALEGGFLEAETQTINLPEEDPVIFSFVVAYLYEEKFAPIRAVASVLIQTTDKGKGRENDTENSGDDYRSDSSDILNLSDDSIRTRSRRASRTRRRRAEREWSQRQLKQPGRHRPDCNCNTCTGSGHICWNCGVPRTQVMPQPPPPHPGPPPRRNARVRPERGPPGVRPPRQPYPPPPGTRPDYQNNFGLDDPTTIFRMSEEDVRTWSMAYSLSIDVYVCAERYLMKDFKACIATYLINHFEAVGLEAANPSVLESCRTLHAGLSLMDPLLKKVFARVGFLQARMWKKFPEFTSCFFAENPELAMLIMKEMAERREEDERGDLPAMERANQVFHPNGEFVHPRRRQVYEY